MVFTVIIVVCINCIMIVALAELVKQAPLLYRIAKISQQSLPKYYFAHLPRANNAARGYLFHENEIKSLR